MILELQSLNTSLNIAYRKQSLKRNQIDTFKSNLKILLSKINETESEENQKNNVSDFLKDTYYKQTNEINTKGRKDLVIHNGSTAESTVGVIIEVKRPNNRTEMISHNKPNAKAMHELIHYYLQERYIKNNKEIKHLIITNIYEWFIFDAMDFERYFFEHQQLINDYKLWNDKLLVGITTDWFYKEIAQPFIENGPEKLSCSYFDLHFFQSILSTDNHQDEQKLIDLYKILSPEHLLKKPFANDSNTLNKNFYNELLHIIGLEETKDAGKKIIRRKSEKERNPGSLLEDTIRECESKIKSEGIAITPSEGRTKDEEVFSIALELCITWLNRILFLKLLEGQLIKYHKGDKLYSFLNENHIRVFKELNDLFFEVLARKTSERDLHIRSKFENIPYLNSSLFDITDLEKDYIKIKDLRDSLEIPVFSQSVLKSATGSRTTGNKNTLHYLFEFLDAYDFASDSAAEIQEQNKTIINASVLGLIFEKINGYKDGSFFTPGFITMYMCRETIRRAVVEKFNERFGWSCANFTDLFNKLGTITLEEANATVNSIKICDPAVGSGHFLVSALNEIICIKSELQILTDRTGKLLRGYKILIENDELIITFDEEIFSYNYKNPESQRVQETLFHEKQTIIENCLFGVDINPKSVMICRLRLWIELLKNAYYKRDSNSTELETLPNIDINIKCGNSLLSRFALDADLSKALKSIKYDMNAYRGFVQEYKNATSRELKVGLMNIINSIKSDFRTEILKNDPKILRHSKLSGELLTLLTQISVFEPTEKEKKERKQKKEKLEADIAKLAREIEDIKSNALYKNAFEWRFEFPEVLNDNGDFVGFDVVIGNPPYVQLQSMGKDADALANSNYYTYARTGDIYSLFYENGNNILRKNGLLAFITSNKWMRAGYGESTRKFFAEKTNPVLLIDFAGQKIFENATVDTNILLFQKAPNTGSTKSCIAKNDLSENLSDFIRQEAVSIPFTTSDSWVILNPIEQRIKQKIEAIGTPLKDWDINIYRGVLTGYNDAFIIDGAKKDELIAQDPKSAEIIRPILRGRDIKRYGYEFADLYLIATFPSRSYNIDEFPAVKEHLLSFGYDRLKQTGESGARKKTSNKWFETQDSISYWEDFFKPKIVYPGIMRIAKSNTKNFPRFTLDNDNNFFFGNDCYFLVGKHTEYLWLFLNTTLLGYLFRYYIYSFDETGFKIFTEYFQNIPIPLPTPQTLTEVTILLNDPINISKIDSWVYELFGLDEEEIIEIENSVDVILNSMKQTSL